MIQRLISAYKRFVKNIWLASIDSAMVLLAIAVWGFIVVLVLLSCITIWPAATIGSLTVFMIARLIYAGITSR